jgi:UDP-N-acetyl-2-amino-2-deoxyglucuronate dehydrogenase
VSEWSCDRANHRDGSCRHTHAVTLRVGFLGAGFISVIHRWLLAHCGVEHVLAAVHDPDTPRAHRFAEATGAAVVDEDDLMAGADVVFVCAWTSEHPPLAARAADAGRAVFCEKPLAVDAALAMAMAEQVERAGVVNQVGLILRHLPGYVLARHLLGDERAGPVMTASMSDDQFIPVQGRYASTWRADPARAGRGALLEHSIHDVDVLRWMVGPISAVSGRSREFHGLAQIDDATVARLDFANGALGTLTTVWHDMLERPNMRRLEVLCERLHVVVEGDAEATVRWRFAGEEAHQLGGSALAQAARAAGGEAGGPLVSFGAGHVFNPLTQFLEAARDGTPSPLPFTAALPAHQLVDALYRSADSGGGVVQVAP